MKSTISQIFGIGAVLTLFSIHPVLAQLEITKRTVDGSMTGAYWVFAYDVNKDNRPDVVAGSGSQGVRWYRSGSNDNFTRNDVDGGFYGVWTATAFDIDGDGDVDIVASSTAQDVVAWWEKTNSGYVKHVVDDVSQDPESFFATDLDSDGDGDIIVGGWESNELVWVENQDSIFVRRVIDASFKNVHSVYAADLNNDGRMDILASGSNKTLYWLNNGNGTFAKRTFANDGGWSIFPIDLNGDGMIDVVRSHRITRSIDWFRNNGGGNFASAKIIDANFATGMSPSPDTTEIWSVAGGDLDGDGDNDVVAALYPKFNPNSNGYVYTWLNQGNQQFTEFVVDSLVKGPRSVAVGDFDKDGDADIAVSANNGVFWYETQFSSTPTILVTQPNGGENLTGGSSYAIQWSNTLTIANVKIEYSTNNGASWTQIVASAPNTGSYLWAVPNVSTSSALIRVSEAVTGIPSDASNSAFAVTPVSLTLTAPNGGENWLGDSLQNILWTTSGTVPTVKLEYSIDNGANWTTIVAGVANTGNFNWTVPDVQTASALVRVSKSDDPSIFDSSDAVFTISGSSLTILAPNGGEVWGGGSNQQISWTSSGSVTSVKLEYSIDNGQSWSAIIANTENDGAFLWATPEANTSTALVRISDAGDGLPFDVGNATFSITSESLTLVSPNGGEFWSAGSQQIISWSSTASITTIRLEYSINGGVSWTTIVGAASNIGSYNWVVPANGTSAALVRVSDATDGNPADVSDGVFTIQVPNTVTLIKPNGGEVWLAGGMHEINWTSTGAVNDIKIEYTINDGANWTTVTTSTNNDGSFTWNLPTVESTAARVRVSAVNAPAVFDMSDGVFVITANPALKVNFPNGGESWTSGSAQEIRWVAPPSIAAVKIEYSVNNGGSWGLIKDTTPNDGVFGWNVPDVETNAALVRISDFNNPSTVDFSDAPFSIVSSQTLTLTSPNGGETWLGGTTHSVVWSSNDIASVKLEYSLNNGSTWTAIASSIPSSGNYSWTVPDLSATSVLVRVSDASDGSPADVSNGVFSIVGASLTLTSPNGGEVLSAGSIHSIHWSSTGVVNAVNLYYSIDNGANWIAIANNLTNNGMYAWRVPNVITETALVRISDTNNATRFDVSNGVFKIQIPGSSLSLVSPNGGEVLQGGTNIFVLWNSSGVPSVKLEYSANSGESWNVIVENIVNVGSYLWNVPNAASASARLRISRVDNGGAPSDLSDNFFTIHANPTSVSQDKDAQPQSFELSQNYPNPFNLGTKIEFGVPRISDVVLEIYNIRGERVRTLHSGQMGSGRYTAFWDGLNSTGEVVASGLYVYRIRIGEWHSARILTLMK
jgi:hypothetical protein